MWWLGAVWNCTRYWGYSAVFYTTCFWFVRTVACNLFTDLIVTHSLTLALGSDLSWHSSLPNHLMEHGGHLEPAIDDSNLSRYCFMTSYASVCTNNLLKIVTQSCLKLVKFQSSGFTNQECHNIYHCVLLLDYLTTFAPSFFLKSRGSEPVHINCMPFQLLVLSAVIHSLYTFIIVLVCPLHF